MTLTQILADDPVDFETIYAEADGDATLIPWADQCPNPALVSWLNHIAPSLVRCGGRVAVVGCGLGDDAQELIHRGYDVTAFDCSTTAVQWARRRDLQSASCYHIADLFNPPPKWRHRFDLVVEINTIQSLQPSSRNRVVKSIANLLSPHGHLLVICRSSDSPIDDESGPPWPMTCDQLLEATTSAGLVPYDKLTSFMDDEIPPRQRLRAVFHRL